MIATTKNQGTDEPRWTGVQEFFASVDEGIGPYADLPSGVTVTFDLKGAGGGIFTVRRERDRLEVLRIDALRPDCRLTCAVDDFLDLLEGRLDSRHGFLEGLLDVEGDVGLVLRLERALARNTPL